MYYYDPEKYEELHYDRLNVIESSKIHVLPHVTQNFAVVKIYLTTKTTIIVESQHHPIRYGKHCGSRIHLGATYGKIDYNPKLIWNGKEWMVQTHGTFLFAEVELNEERKACKCTQ